MKPWRQVGQTEVVHDGWRKVFRKTFTTNAGSEYVAEISGKDGAAGASVIALTPDNQVVIARQFRVGPQKVMEELPGGVVDQGEDPDAAVARELREETGFVAGSLVRIGTVHKGSYSASVHHFYLAVDCHRVDSVLNLDEGEEIEVDLVSISQLFENARKGKMTDTEALFFAYETLKEREDM